MTTMLKDLDRSFVSGNRVYSVAEDQCMPLLEFHLAGDGKNQMWTLSCEGEPGSQIVMAEIVLDAKTGRFVQLSAPPEFEGFETLRECAMDAYEEFWQTAHYQTEERIRRHGMK